MEANTILLVEDEALIAMMEVQQLMAEGYKVIHVPSGEKAINLIFEEKEQIDLILMDIDLGKGIDGTETAQKILKSYDIPLLFLSSHAEKEIVQKTEKITNYGYVVKNSSITVLDASIKMAFKLFQAHKNIESQSKNLEIAYEEMRVTNNNLVLSEARLLKSETSVRNKLKAILEPDGDIGTLELSDIIDSQALQSLMEDFYDLTGILGAILDIKGNILVAIGWQDICTKFHRCHPITEAHCKESDTLLTQGVPVGTFKTYRCKNNMLDMVTPLVVNNNHIGNIFIGQFIYEDEEIDFELFRSQAKKYGFAEEEYIAALNKVPRFSREKVNKGIAFYAKIAEMISNLSYSSIMLSRTATEQKNAEDKIQKLLVEKELILKEVHHRIKNNMVMLMSLLNLQAEIIEDTPCFDVLQKIHGRVQSMMLLYDKLYQTSSFTEISVKNYLPALISEIIDNTKNGKNIDLVLDIDDFILDSKRLQYIGIIVNELITNIMKFAFNDKADGLITISSNQIGQKIVIIVQDNGSGIPEIDEKDKSHGFGLFLIKTLIEQLDGTLKIERDNGTKVFLEFLK